MTKTLKAEINIAENKCNLTENLARTPQAYTRSAVLFQRIILRKISGGQKPITVLTMQNVPAKSERSGRFMTRDGATSPHIW